MKKEIDERDIAEKSLLSRDYLALVPPFTRLCDSRSFYTFVFYIRYSLRKKSHARHQHRIVFLSLFVCISKEIPLRLSISHPWGPMFAENVDTVTRSPRTRALPLPSLPPCRLPTFSTDTGSILFVLSTLLVLAGRQDRLRLLRSVYSPFSSPSLSFFKEGVRCLEFL